jgi:hypothetical protein
MPRTKKAETDTQIYKLAAWGAKVTIEYDPSNPPPFYQPGPGVVIVGNHVCGASTAAPGQVPQETEGGPSLAEIREFQRRREEPARTKPLTSEDIAREQGFNPAAVDFDNIAAIASQMAPVEDVPI